MGVVDDVILSFRSETHTIHKQGVLQDNDRSSLNLVNKSDDVSTDNGQPDEKATRKKRTRRKKGNKSKDLGKDGTKGKVGENITISEQAATKVSDNKDGKDDKVGIVPNQKKSSQKAPESDQVKDTIMPSASKVGSPKCLLIHDKTLQNFNRDLFTNSLDLNLLSAVSIHELLSNGDIFQYIKTESPAITFLNIGYSDIEAGRDCNEILKNFKSFIRLVMEKTDSRLLKRISNWFRLGLMSVMRLETGTSMNTAAKLIVEY